MNERRIYPRHQLICYLKLQNRDTGTVIGHVVDISPEGCLVMSDTPIEQTRTLCLRFLPATCATEQQPLEVDAICKWCKKEQFAGFYDAGFEFTNLTAQQATEVEALVQKYCCLQ